MLHDACFNEGNNTQSEHTCCLNASPNNDNFRGAYDWLPLHDTCVKQVT